jgi:predicted MFS family arabinose efflux permease
MLSITFAVASGLGPIIGGVTEQFFGWRASFAVIPFTCAVAAYLIAKYFPLIKPEQSKNARIDWLGAVLIMLTVGLLLFSLEVFVGHFSSVKPIWGLVMFLGCCLSGWVLIQTERRVAMPIFPLRVLKTSQAQWLNIAALLCGAVMFILIFYIPLLLQNTFHYTPTIAGMLMIPLVAGIPLGSIVSGRMFARMQNPQHLMVGGSAVLGLGCLVALTLTESSDVYLIILATALCGAGLGFMLPNLTLFSQMIVKQQDVGVSSALIQTSRALGSAIGTALVGMAIAQTSVIIGLRVGLIFSVIICALLMLISMRIKMSDYT